MRIRPTRATTLLGLGALVTVLTAGCGIPNQPAALPSGQLPYPHNPWDRQKGVNLPAYEVNGQAHQDVSANAIAFASNNVGLTVGEFGIIMRTNDGGKTWSRLPRGAGKAVPSGWGAGLRGVAWVTPTAGTTPTVAVVVGYNGTILRSTDSGATFTQIASGTTSDLQSVTFIPGTNTGYAVGNSGVILKSTDGGLTWTPQTSGITEDLRAVAFGNATDGVAVGDHGRVLWTHDGGLTWAAGWAPQDSWMRAAYWVPNTQTVYIGGAAPHFNGAGVPGVTNDLYKSTDGGQTWTAEPISNGQTGKNAFNETAYTTGLYFSSPTTGWSVNEADINMTTNGGKTWTNVFAASGNNVTYWLMDIAAMPNGTMWSSGTPSTAGSGGIWHNTFDIVSSNAAGTTWTTGPLMEQPSPF